MRSRIGHLFSLTSFGESHGKAVGGVIDGVPAGVKLDLEKLQHDVSLRSPGRGVASSRKESDKVEILSGIYEGVTLGTPIGFIVRNEDRRPQDYDNLKNAFRPSHADFTYQAKYAIRDPRGGGRASARETVARVVAGCIAKQILKTVGIEITAFASQIGKAKIDNSTPLDYEIINTNEVRCPSPEVATQMLQEINAARAEGDTLGGVVACIARGVPAGLGEPVFDKLTASLAQAMMSIPAAKAVEFGAGKDFAHCRGSEVIDLFAYNNGAITTLSNYSGGIQGGISNGNDITLNVTFKPIATLMREVETIDNNGNMVTLPAGGRHDCCAVPRAVPVVEAMAAIVILDHYLMNRTARI